MPTSLDELRVLAEKAKAWRPVPSASCGNIPVNEDLETNCGSAKCSACAGAMRAVEDIALHVDGALIAIEEQWRNHAPYSMQYAARVASYFASEQNPVSAFSDAAEKLLKEGARPTEPWTSEPEL